MEIRSQTETLTYAPRTSQRGRLVRRITSIGLLVLVTVIAARWGPGIYRQAGVKWDERRLLHYKALPGTVVLTNVASECAALFALQQHVLVDIGYTGSGESYSQLVAGFAPPMLDALQPKFLRGFNPGPSNAAGPTGPRPTLFLHKLQAPGQPPRLVHVRPRLYWRSLDPVTEEFVIGPWQQFLADHPDAYSYEPDAWKLFFEIDVYELASWRPGSVMNSVMSTSYPEFGVFAVPPRVEPPPPGATGDDDEFTIRICDIRLFAGHVDPNDPARFEFDYELDGKKGTIRGELGADETVAFTVQQGPLKPWPAAAGFDW